MQDEEALIFGPTEVRDVRYSYIVTYYFDLVNDDLGKKVHLAKFSVRLSVFF